MCSLEITWLSAYIEVILTYRTLEAKKLQYHFGFSLKGLIIFLLPMIPNLFFFLLPAPAGTASSVSSTKTLDFLEHGSQGIFIFLLIFFVSNKASQLNSPYTIAMGIMLALYYLLWIVYFTGHVTLLIQLGLAVLPVFYFIFGELWLHNPLAIIPTIIFGIFHVIITLSNYSLLQQY